MLCPHCKKPYSYDPTGLLAAKEPVATVADLAPIVGVSVKQLRTLLRKRIYGKVRFLRPVEGPWLYCIEDVRVALVPLRGELEARRVAHEKQQATDMANRTAKVAAAVAADASKPKRPAPIYSAKPKSKTTLPDFRSTFAEVMTARPRRRP